MKKDLYFAGGMLAAFGLWTAAACFVDVAAIGPEGSTVGFAAVNGFFHNLTGVHMSLYQITDWLGLIPLLVCILFGVIGFVQLIKRRSILKVDRDLIFLGVYYIIVIFGYLIFEMIPINYRPILIEGFMEASYPSSTTLLVLSVMPTLIEQVNRRSEKAVIKKIISILTIFFSVFMVLGRLVSGVHWFTDIVGSAFLSIGLFCIYKAIILLCYKEN